jgi:hypothetical protein
MHGGEMNLKALSAPFNPNDVHWRIGSKGRDNTASALAYIDARNVMDRLDEVVGPENWQRRHSIHGDFILCEIGIKIDGEWVWKADGAEETRIEAQKGGLSDAFKRAAVSWGVGRYLYGLDTPWVKLTQDGRKILESEKKKLYAILGTDPADMPPIDVGRATGTPDSQQSSPDDSLENFIIHADSNIEMRNGISHCIEDAKSVQAVENFYLANRGWIDRYKNNYPKDHAALLNEFKQRKADLAQAPMMQYRKPFKRD